MKSLVKNAHQIFNQKVRNKSSLMNVSVLTRLRCSMFPVMKTEDKIKLSFLSFPSLNGLSVILSVVQ